MRCLCFLIVAFAVSIACYGQSALTLSDNFIETLPPKSGSEEWSALNRSNAFGVKLVGGKLAISKVEQRNSTELKIPKGMLVGVDHGEWGGKLIFKPTLKTKESVEIKSGNIQFIFSFQDKIYFIEGLAHLSISEGSLYELSISNQKFTYRKILDFEDAPEAFTIYRDRLLIVTHKNFYLLKDFKKKLIFKDAFWQTLYPNSIAAIDEQTIYIGLRGGIVRLDLVKKTMKFYKPRN
ncbi:hypothetical protein [Xanthocytophaga flava]|uniref:hypothetical protein n=1 Tax=Xanthocytophaga flava TaxID=3048013 RepID=UPI0028D478A4|nr:hypothetical protein [Xanthocytophaga flavus]MDJ1470822.1 hypothetical protein [Xanthocytophaga flavus]